MMPRMAIAGREAVFAGGCLLLGGLLWLLGHPYAGVWHDARLYMLAAAHWSAPASYARDLFFIFGSQDDFTLFSPLYGALIHLAGGNAAAISILLGGALLWLLAHYVLARIALGRTSWGALFVLAGAMLTLSYSPNGMGFVLSEGFATARSIAMPVGLLAVGGLVAGRARIATGLALLALAIHPLSGIWVLLLVLSHCVSFRVLFGLGIGGLAGMLAFGLADLPLAAFRPMAADWLEAVRAFSTDVLLKSPGESRLDVYLVALAVLFLGGRFGSPQLVPMYRRIALLAGGGLLAAVIASYVFPLALFVQLQFWRVFWLVLPLAMLALLDLAARSWWRHGEVAASAWAIVVILLLLLPSWPGAVLLLGGVAAAWLPNAAALGVRAVEVLARYPTWRRLAVAGVLVVALPGLVIDLPMLGHAYIDPRWEMPDWSRELAAGAIWLLPVGGAALLGGRQAVQWALLLGALLALPWAAAVWDRRPASLQADEQCYLSERCVAHPFKSWIKPGDTVYWPDRELRVAFLLGTSNYTSDMHRSGLVFSEAKFREFDRRARLIGAAERSGHLEAVCRDRDLDWLISKESQSASRSTFGHAVQTEDGGKWLLIRCSDWRQGDGRTP